MIPEEHTEIMVKSAVPAGTTNVLVSRSFGYYNFKVTNRPFCFSGAFWFNLKNAFFTFGLPATISILLRGISGLNKATFITLTPIITMVTRINSPTVIVGNRRQHEDFRPMQAPVQTLISSRLC